MKLLFAIFTAAAFAISAAIPAIAEESNELIPAPAITANPSDHKAKKVKKARKAKKVAKHKTRQVSKARHK